MNLTEARTIITEALRSQNTGYGFHGTMWAGLDGFTEPLKAQRLTDVAWAEASEAVAEAIPYLSPEKVRELLDSRWGRHFADSVLDAGGLSRSRFDSSPAQVKKAVRGRVAHYKAKGWLRERKLKMFISLRESAALEERARYYAVVATWDNTDPTIYGPFSASEAKKAEGKVRASLDDRDWDHLNDLSVEPMQEVR